MNKEILKERYKRHNEYEHDVLCATIDNLPEVTIYDKNNDDSIVQVRKKSIKGIGIFLDAENPNLTLNGNHRKTEFRLSVNKKDIWVEVKQQKSISNLLDAVMGEIIRANKLNGEYWLVLLGEGYRYPKLILEYCNLIKKYKLEQKVKLISSIDEYKIALLKAVA